MLCSILTGIRTCRAHSAPVLLDVSNASGHTELCHMSLCVPQSKVDLDKEKKRVSAAVQADKIRYIPQGETPINGKRLPGMS